MNRVGDRKEWKDIVQQANAHSGLPMEEDDKEEEEEEEECAILRELVCTF
jgi:hypothetical protein